MFGAYLYAKNRTIFVIRDRLENIWGRWDFYFNPQLADISKTEFAGYILQMREVSALFTVITILLLYSITLKLVKNPFIALFVPVVISFHPLFQNTMLRATSDAPMVCFTCLAIYILMTVWYKKSKYGTFILGCVLGLAISSKLTGFLGIGIWGIYELLDGVFKKKSWIYIVKRMGMTVLGIIIIWFGSNPAVYTYPIQHSVGYMTFRIRQSVLLEQYFPEPALTTIPSRIHTTYCTLFDRSCSTYTGNIFSFFWLNIMLFLSGMAWLISMLRKKGNDEVLVSIIMVYIIMSVNTAYIPIDHDQYYLLPFICMAIVSCLGIGYIWNYRMYLCNLIRKPRHFHDGV
jgi:4-amino-4-deoxy-L-arabinose transferase-like glycosyltransferase